MKIFQLCLAACLIAQAHAQAPGGLSSNLQLWVSQYRGSSGICRFFNAQPGW